jgi:hypothetical protein
MFLVLFLLYKCERNVLFFKRSLLYNSPNYFLPSAFLFVGVNYYNVCECTNHCTNSRLSPVCDFRTENYFESGQWSDSTKRVDGNHGPIWRWKVIAAEHSHWIQVSHGNDHKLTPIYFLICEKF